MLRKAKWIKRSRDFFFRRKDRIFVNKILRKEGSHNNGINNTINKHYALSKT